MPSTEPKPQIVPLFFQPGRDDGFDRQLVILRELFGDVADFLPPVALGESLPAADAVVFPQLLGEGYRCLAAFKAITLPILIITSEFGTFSMWDWELMTYLREAGVPTLAPRSPAQARKMFSALRVRAELRGTKFLVYQDNPGEGQQAPIFKRFYWWESEAVQRMTDRFGIRIEKRSFKELGERSRSLPDADAVEARRSWGVPTEDLSDRALNSATKLYLAVKRDLDADRSIRAVGINCLNESHFCDSTPCLAWNRLHLEGGFIWGCEGDVISMLNQYILNKSLGAPAFMTNLYPFLMGDAALRHERMTAFPPVKGNPDDYILVAHCGYTGLIPQSYATEWNLKKKVLRIVDENAVAIDARIPEGPLTLAKIHSDFSTMTVAEGELEGYSQQPGTDCLTGGVVRVKDGKKLLSRLASHHFLLMHGHYGSDIGEIAPIFGLRIDEA
ncbi:hypothetical protein SAMN05444156_1271 [Verrucomicrobium sp. GAS474]|uniref:hypothetical protein n=1 Tax=Verrucomicrobium sp. GAS474 TaxID=1882831 RepID=UPI00087D503A|nr:hypothetical protein [Verrucomicrobium sp. GAS474]SDT98727.1 hypothetical protein SAMN05444156_1271 [Verrucomicrobium sp. GAS474]